MADVRLVGGGEQLAIAGRHNAVSQEAFHAPSTRLCRAAAAISRRVVGEKARGPVVISPCVF
jgi:hypothetical protein